MCVASTFVRGLEGRCSGRSNEDRFLIPEEPHKRNLMKSSKLRAELGVFFGAVCERANRTDLGRRLLEQRQEQH